MINILYSFFSLKKLRYPGVSFFSHWDKTSKFSSKVHLCPLSRIKSVSIGDYSRVGLNTAISHASIGRYTAIGKGCLINVGRHPTNYITAHSIFYKKNAWPFHPEWSQHIDFDEFPPVSIGSDVWIGVNCIIMGGVTIGNGAIIAAGSIVTKDVPPYAIVGGTPAKVIKYRFEPDVVKRLLEIKWWDLSDEEISCRLDLFHIQNPSLKDLDRFFPV